MEQTFLMPRGGAVEKHLIFTTGGKGEKHFYTQGGNKDFYTRGEEILR